MTEQGSSTTPLRSDTHLDEQGWYVCSGMTLREAEELLDWLDHVGCPAREVQIETAGTTVRWRPDPAHTPNRD